MMKFIVFLSLLSVTFASRDLHGTIIATPLCDACGGGPNLGGFNNWIPQTSQWTNNGASNEWYDQAYVHSLCNDVLTNTNSLSNFQNEANANGLGTVPSWVNDNFVSMCVYMWDALVPNKGLHSASSATKNEAKNKLKCGIACLRKVLKRDMDMSTTSNPSTGDWGLFSVKTNLGWKCLDKLREGSDFSSVVSKVDCICDHVQTYTPVDWVYPVNAVNSC